MKLLKTLAMITCCSSALSLSAEVTVSKIFSSDMMLQRDKAVTVWGTADNSEKISVEIAGQKHETKASSGKWSLKLDPLKAGGPHKMSIQGNNKIELENILVGDIWLCGGQSNMDYDVRSYVNWGRKPHKEYTSIVNNFASYDKIRLAKMNKISTLPDQYDVPFAEDKAYKGKWMNASDNKELILGSSAVGFVFAKKLQHHLQIPIGLIDANRGGSFISLWEPPHALKAKGERRPARNMFNSMIGSYAHGFPIKGVIWYQGESDAINLQKAQQYEKTFKAMIEGWRHEFKDPDMPFLFVQLASYERNPYQHGITYPVLRDAQSAALELKNTGMAVAIDLGMIHDIHPPQKIEVSERLLLAAKKIAYGEKIEFSGPLYKSHEIKGNKFIVSFAHSAKGLKAKTVDLDGTMLNQNKLQGFELAGTDQVFYPAAAKIKGDSVEVTCSEVKKPIALRYAYKGFPYANLYNSVDLPCSPFRTDSFEIKFNPDDAKVYARNLFLSPTLRKIKMTLAQKRQLIKIHDQHLNPEMETKRRQLWDARITSMKKYGSSSQEMKKSIAEYNDFIDPLLKQIDADVSAQGIFQTKF
ncbi:sialate O-acetylesterase [Lentisphaera profundi]|uniref:Sialate O-acetylesterase n=1 Tax=Lentisphaera profundi TaxID=1658616 RepID=A0ABY7VRA3_9BACT|nr:sialate O-acetylesterase [Lentisphaera profundi]WDE96557.1 sialate O-acetylesterase [Lentisphaera profundi]